MVRKLVLVLAAPLLIASSCADEGSQEVLTGDAAVAAVRAAPDAAAEAGSGRFEMTMTFDTPEGAFDISAAGGFAGDQMSMEMDFGESFAAMAEASGEQLPPGFDEPMQIVIDGDTGYLRMPMLESLTGTAGWLSLTPEELGQAGSSFGGTPGATDPSQMLETLRGVSDDIEEVGTEEVRGVETTHLTATVDLRRAFEQLPADQREQLEGQLGDLDAAVPVEVWIDGDRLVRRMEMDLSSIVSQTTGGAAGSATMRIEFFDYGEDVAIEVPDASEVTPFGDVLGGFGGAG